MRTEKLFVQRSNRQDDTPRCSFLFFFLLLFLEKSSKKSRCESFSGPQTPCPEKSGLDPSLALRISDRRIFIPPRRLVGTPEKSSSLS